MRILFVYNNIFSQDGGGVQNISLALSSSFVNLGITIDYLSIVDKDLVVPKDYLYHILYFSESRETVKSEFTHLIYSNRIDIVVNQTFGVQVINWCLSQVSDDVKIISVVHTSLLNNMTNAHIVYENYFPILLNNTLVKALIKSSVGNNLLKLLYRMRHGEEINNSYKVSDKVIVLSKAWVDEITYFTKGNEKVIVIPNFNVREPLSSIDVGLKKEMVVNVSRLDDKIKRSDLLLKIFQRLAAQNPDVAFVISGNGDYKDKLVSIIENSHLKNLYFVEAESVVSLYEQASIFCSTSASESFGLTVLESMGYGCVPVIFNSYPVASEMVTDGISGRLIDSFNLDDFQEAVQEILENPRLRDELAYKAIEESKRYTRDFVVGKWHSMLVKLLNE